MNVTPSFRGTLAVLAFAAGALPPTSVGAQSTPANWDSGKWQFAATIYGFIPTIEGKVNYNGDFGGSDIHVSKSGVLDALKMTFMGAFDVHNGRWGAFTDILYVDLGGSHSKARDFSIGNIGIPAGATADLSLDLKSLVWTLAGEYRIASDPAWTVDLLAGARLLEIKPTLGYTINGDLGPVVLPGRNGTKQVKESVWDGIVGVKGRYAFGDERKWYVPFYLDVGTGQTKLTWQVAAGVGYTYHWGDVFATWRYLDWNAKSGKPIENLSLNGPMIGATFRW